MSEPKKLKAFFLRSREDDMLRADKEWLASVGTPLACPGRTHLGKKWRARPTPIDLMVNREPMGAKAGFFHLDVSILHKNLYRALKPHMHGILVGKVLVGPAASPTASPYISIAVPPAIAIDPYRDVDCQHVQCRKCGEIRSTNFADEALALHSLRGRQLWPTEGGLLYIDEALITKLRLRTRFPDLSFRRIPILPEPLDGDILPEDPSWSGTFRTQRRTRKANAGT